MAHFLKHGLIWALACPCILAATCTSNQCLADDEVSLMQVNQIINKRRPAKADSDTAELTEKSSKKTKEQDQPAVNLQATIDPVQALFAGPGAVVTAYETNKGKIADAIAGNTKSDLDFEDQVRDVRKFDRAVAEEQVAKDAKAVHFAIEAEKNNVRKTAAKRKLIEHEAADKVEAAKASAAAHMEKERQANAASVLGRLDGVREGYDRAGREIVKQNEEWANSLENRKLEEAEEAAVRHRNEVREAITAVSDRMRENADAVSRRAGEDAAAWIKKARSQAHDAEQGIEGADGIKNHLIKSYADSVANDYQRIVNDDEAAIVSDDLAMWPKADWPVLEPGTPLMPDPLVPDHIH